MRFSAKSLFLVVLLVAAFAVRGADAAELTVFGDSYSAPAYRHVPSWVTQLKGQGVGPVHDFARSGATASSAGGNTFADQIRRWRSAHRPLGDTVVYLGYNDIPGDLARGRAGYRAGIDALIAGGATSGGNHLFLVLPHDVGNTPRYNGDAASRNSYRDRTKQWDSFVRSVATRAHATVIDLFSVFDKIVADPKSESFTNVTTADHAHSRTTALYNDAFHFGQHGQAIIARTIRARVPGL
jgi:phospholipase/lecithinase/hemolysin